MRLRFFRSSPSSRFFPLIGLPPSEPPENASLYGTAAERIKHQRYLEILAETCNRPIHIILPVYEHVLSDLKSHATVTDYLPILVAKRVRQLLKA